MARAGFQGAAGRGGSDLPTAGNADLEVRVNQTILPIPYIQRDAEATIRDHLREGRPVLLIGPSMVGKTKMAARVIAEEFGSTPVAIPDNAAAFAELDAKDVTLQGSVVWLDDIDRLIGPGGITDEALRRLAAAENIIVGTIRARAYEHFLPSDQLRPPEWDVLDVFARVFISRGLSGTEQDRLSKEVVDPEIRNRIGDIGLGEYVGAAGQVVEALKLGAAGTDPLGYALVLAAADWRRSGMTRPVPSNVLARLAGAYLDQRDRALLTDRDTFDAALAWATRDINPNVSLLQRASLDSFIIYDYALDFISSQDRPIPTESWDVILTSADDNELLDAGRTANVFYHRVDVAIKAYRRAADSQDPFTAAFAAFSMGVLLKQQGDLKGAKAAWKGVSDASPEAAVKLGELLERRRDIEGAETVYRQAIDSGHPDAAPKAAVKLGELLEERRDIEGAETVYRQAIDSGHPDGAVKLGELLEKRGDTEGAETLYRQAIDSGHPDAAPKAAVKLGELLEERWDIEGAETLYRQAIDSGHPDTAPKADIKLEHLLDRRRRIRSTKAALKQAIDSGNADDAAWEAANKLEGLLWGNVDSVKAILQQVIDSGYPRAAPTAAFKLGYLLAGRDHEGAKAAYQKAIDFGHPDLSPQAAINLGNMLQLQGDDEGAKAAWKQVIASKRGGYTAKASVNLGFLLERQGDIEGAKTAYQRAIDFGDTGVAPTGAESLKDLLRREQQSTDTDDYY